MHRFVALIAAFALALVMAAPTAAITGGAADGQRHLSTGAILGRDASTGEYFFVCSGSLLSEDQFLTAAHCSVWEAIGQTAADVFVTFDADLHMAQPFRWGLFGPVVEPDHVIGLALDDPRSIMPGFWLPPSGAQSRNDVGVLNLARPAEEVYPGIEPVELPPAGLLAELAAQGGLIGHSFTNVGYGFQSVSFTNPTTPIEFTGLRMLATTPYSGLDSNHLAMLQNAPATDEGGICIGDSGGPNFLGAAGTTFANLEVALNVGRGVGLGCGTGTTASQRLDLPAVLAFLAAATAGH